MVRVGIVMEIMDGIARVAASPKGACGHCSEQGACGLVLFSGKDDNRQIIVATNPIDAKPGDLVEIDLSGPEELCASALVWGLPLVGLIGGAVAGVSILGRLGMSENAGALSGCGLGLVAAWLLLKLINRRIQANRSLTPRILNVIKTQACQEHVSDL